jgi:hypothetical protein
LKLEAGREVRARTKLGLEFNSYFPKSTMSLSISLAVELVKDRDANSNKRWTQEIEDINRVLSLNGYPQHVEPDLIEATINYRGSVNIPYSWVHYLRRAVAYAINSPEEFSSLGDGEAPINDECYEEESYNFSSHLICHSDDGGYYVPVNFPEPLFDRENRLLGGFLGSSQQALIELIQTAPLLEILLKDDNISPQQEAAILNAGLEEDDPYYEYHPYWIERVTWLYFFDRLQLSVKLGSALVFA